MDHRDTENTEDAQRVEIKTPEIAGNFMNTLSVYGVSVSLLFQFLCATSVPSVPPW